MAPKFGTSGLRGLVAQLTPDLVAAHVRAFLRACPVGTGLYVGRDLRASSPRIAADIVRAARSMGVDVVDCGATPTPALALAAMGAGAAAVMVTGSHIPDDRNGLKFYTPAGEITKAHEAAILAALDADHDDPRGQGGMRTHDAAPAFIERYPAAFGPDALCGRRIALWSHSAVGRDILGATLRALGADVVEIARADHFIPVDTEAVSSADRAFLRQVAADTRVDAIVSTDGDGDRPLVADATGRVVPGDVLGQITAALLGAEFVVTPVSSNTGVEAGGAFARVVRTRIGSPFVIAGMEATGGRVVGYEANGGFLLGFDAQGPAGVLPALMTRDSHLPIIAVLVAAGPAGLAARVGAEPARFTAADRLQDVPTDRSADLVARLTTDASARAALLSKLALGSEQQIDTIDGLRITATAGTIIHLRPSGNAPELRFYVEAASGDDATAVLHKGLSLLADHLRGQG